jgi:hypothetical protein
VIIKIARSRAHRTHVATVFLAVLLAACIYVPRTIETYDGACKIVSRQMVLEAHQVGMLGHCHNDGCVAALAVIGAVTAASVVVSGSIVLAGNVVYWFEKRGQCVPPYPIGK